MFEDVEEVEMNGRACETADRRSIDLARTRVSVFSTEDAEELNELAEKRIGDDHFSTLVMSFA